MDVPGGNEIMPWQMGKFVHYWYYGCSLQQYYIEGLTHTSNAVIISVSRHTLIESCFFVLVTQYDEYSTNSQNDNEDKNNTCTKNSTSHHSDGTVIFRSINWVYKRRSMLHGIQFLPDTDSDWFFQRNTVMYIHESMNRSGNGRPFIQSNYWLHPLSYLTTKILFAMAIY